MNRVNFKLSNGTEVKDEVSGGTGIINGSAIWLNGCVQYSVQPKIKKGETEMPTSWWIDEDQLTIVGEGVNIKQKETGGQSKRSPSQY